MYTTASLEWKGQTITITRRDDDSIQIHPTIFPSVKAGLREIADARGISYEPSWNTRYLGTRVLKALNGVKTIDDQIEREAMRSSGIIEEESTSSATLVKITFENVAIIEAMISYDSKYPRNSDPRSVPDKKWLKEFKDKFDKTPEAHEPLGQNSPALLEYNFNGYRGSSAFWMHRIGEYYGYNYGNEFNGFDSVKDYPWYYRFLIYNAVCAVDAENSTHINADKVGRKQITDRIVQYKDYLLKQLKDTKNYPLIETLSEETAPKASNFQLWYNVLPTTYTSMSLEVKTANHTLTLNKNKGGNFAAGKLYKIHKDKVTWTKNVTFFYESFDSCDGTGGNDGQWSGTIATSTVRTDNNANWTFENEGGAKACVKLGSSSSLGKATTPALGINTSTATLSFKAGAWDGNKETTTIKVTANNGGTVEPSTITLKKGEWTDYTCTISGATETTTLTFAANQERYNRFFLDEVMVYYGNKPVVKHTQQISFSKTSVECYINDTFTEPILSGNKTTVTYSSSDEKVATVDAASGKVTILSAGKTEITATAEESEEYKTATAKYTLTVNKQTQNLSFEKGSYSVLLADKDSFVFPVVNGAKTPVSYSITLGEGVAQDAITIDPTTGKITINAVGTATITATAEETEEYKAASANYVLTVTEKSEGEGPAVFGNNWNTLFGTTYTDPFNPKANALTLNGSVNGVSIEVKNGTSTNGYIKTGDFRAYKGYTITFTAPEGRTIKSIASTVGGKKFTTGVKADSGTLSIKNNAISWTGDSKTVKLTISGTVSFATITVTL